MSQVSGHTGHIKPRNWWACPQLAYTRYIMTSAESYQWQDFRNSGRVHFQKWKKFWRSWKVLLTLFACYLSCCCLVVSAPPNGLYLPPLHWHQVFTQFGALRSTFLQPQRIWGLRNDCKHSLPVDTERFSTVGFCNKYKPWFSPENPINVLLIKGGYRKIFVSF